MARSKKPDAPKFEPVTIAGYRPEVHSVLTPEADQARMLQEDGERIMLQRMLAETQRLGVLRDYLGVPEQSGAMVLLIHVARKYVPGFEVKVGEQPKKPGKPKVGDRFKTVTEIESVKILRHLSTTTDAIDAVAESRRPSIQPRDLSAKYYKCLDEIKANATALALLESWRLMRDSAPATDDLSELFDEIFWRCERDHLGAVQPHNVTRLRLPN